MKLFEIVLLEGFKRKLKSNDDIYEFIKLIHGEDGPSEIEPILSKGNFEANLTNVDPSYYSNSAHSFPDEKTKKYSLMDIKTRPPILIFNNKVVDGAHRLRLAIERDERTMKAYIITQIKE